MSKAGVYDQLVSEYVEQFTSEEKRNLEYSFHISVIYADMKGEYFLLYNRSLAIPRIVISYVLNSVSKRSISSLLMEWVPHRMPVQDLTGRSVIRRDDDPHALSVCSAAGYRVHWK